MKNNRCNQARGDHSTICELRDRCFCYLKEAFSPETGRLVYDNHVLQILLDDYVIKEIHDVVFPDVNRCPGCAFNHIVNK